MLLAESDAKFKYCPLLKTKDDKLKFCLGSMCMLWRWAGPAGGGEGAQGFCGAAGPVAAVAALGTALDPAVRPIEDY